MLAAGVDGCRAGWICLVREGRRGPVRSACYADAKSLFEQVPRPAALGLDIPVGLLEAGARACDVEARRLLGPRRNSVFTAPLRSMLSARSWEEACALRASIEGKRASKQLWGILPKIREVDAALRTDLAGARAWVREVHPELSFMAWNGGQPMAHAKKRAAGRAEREALVARHFGRDAFAEVRSRHPRKQIANDDILDAFAALWTAERILAGTAYTVPADPPRDVQGLPMEMVV